MLFFWQLLKPVHFVSLQSLGVQFPRHRDVHRVPTLIPPQSQSIASPYHSLSSGLQPSGMVTPRSEANIHIPSMRYGSFTLHQTKVHQSINRELDGLSYKRAEEPASNYKLAWHKHMMLHLLFEIFWWFALWSCIWCSLTDIQNTRGVIEVLSEMLSAVPPRDRMVCVCSGDHLFFCDYFLWPGLFENAWPIIWWYAWYHLWMICT